MTIKIERTTEGVRDFMFDEMERLANGEIDIDRLKAMAGAADTVLKAAAIDIQVRKMVNAERDQQGTPRTIAALNLNVSLGNKRHMLGAA